jgi:hypothetical protein
MASMKKIVRFVVSQKLTSTVEVVAYCPDRGSKSHWNVLTSMRLCDAISQKPVIFTVKYSSSTGIISLFSLMVK